ncbi:Mucin-4 [Mactra antiquata]
MYGPINLPIGFACECDWTRQLYVSVNGFVVLGEPWQSAPPRPPDVPFTRSEQDNTQPKVVAPFWTDLKFKPNVSNIWYHTYYTKAPDGTEWDTNIDVVDNFVRNNSQLADVDTVQAVVITWENMMPMDIDESTADEYLTFQLVLLTDSVKTYAIFNYQKMALNKVKLIGRPAAMLWQCNSVYYNNVFSKYTEIYNITMDGTNTEDDTKGRWIYNLDFCSPYYINHRHICYSWHYNDSRNALNSEMLQNLSTSTPKCPCNMERVMKDKRFVAIGDNCFETVFPTKDDYGNRMCCYDGTQGYSLLTTLPRAGFLSLHNPRRQSSRYQVQDKNSFRDCCVKTDLCSLFTERRPVDNCVGYKFPTPSFMFGDPHIMTLDGLQYTFNGLGEYDLLEIIEDSTSDPVFSLQGRTEKAISSVTNETINATIFSAFSMEDQLNGGYAHVEINLAKDGFIVYSNTFSEAADCTLDFQTEAFLLQKDVRIEKISKTNMIVSFTNGISAEVIYRDGVLDTSLNIPEKYKTNYRISGLMGNYDGNFSNDLTYFNGTNISINSTEFEIYQYGESWETLPSVSRFRYRAGKTHTDFRSGYFQPIFLSDYNTTQIDDASKLCNHSNQCIYDYLATSNTDLALNTQLYVTEAEILQEESKNTAPTVVFKPSKIEAELYQAVNIDIEVYNEDIQDVTLYFNGPEIITVSIHNSTFTYLWNVTDLTPTNISAYAVDTITSSSLSILQVSLCSGCNNNGVCVYGDPIASCICDNGWEGTNCDIDVDGCSLNPCPGESICNDLTPEEEQNTGLKYQCTCMNGYTQIDKKCFDIDECEENTTCDQICTNTEGSYTCSCQQGYKRTSTHCQDTDECLMRCNECKHDCVNLVGTYTCSCKGNYTLQNDGFSCDTTDSMKAFCTSRGCQHGCTIQTNGDVDCFCMNGYTLNKDGRTCDDIDECSMTLCAQECMNTVGSYQCSCYDGFTLSEDMLTCDECPVGYWGPECQESCDCLQAITCNKATGCLCQQGWNGTKCDVNVNECETDVCSYYHNCVDTTGSYVCDCKQGYQRTADNNCENINECLEGGQHDCNPDTEICVDIPGHYQCQCKTGYIRCNTTCEDVDECLATNYCEHTCENVNGTYNCECYPGHLLLDDRRTCERFEDPCVNSANNVTYETCIEQGAHFCILDETNGICACKNGYSLLPDGQCQGINECLENSGLGLCSDICVDIETSFYCDCYNGFKLSNDLLNCQECNITHTWGNNCENQCNCDFRSLYCDSLTGCVCSQGWTGSLCNIDVNECDSSDVCTGNQQCYNTLGSYICSCKPGYILDQHSLQCIDIDECVESNLCNQRCENINGSHVCYCRYGFELESGSDTQCSNINECLSTHTCEQDCIDNAGSYSCLCRDGFYLSEDLRTCIKDNTTDPCKFYKHLCEYGCNVLDNEPICYCGAGFTLNPIDNITCIESNPNLWAIVTVDFDYIDIYQHRSSQEYKDLIDDIRNEMMNIYKSMNLSDFLGVRIESIFPTNHLEISQAVIFDINNVSNVELIHLARILHSLRYNQGYIMINQQISYIVREPTISYTYNGTQLLVTCVLCDRYDDCILTSERNDTYACEKQPDETKSIEIGIEMKFPFSIELLNKLSEEYSSLYNLVRTSLNKLFGQSVTGFAGLGPLAFSEGSLTNGGSIWIRTSVLFNETIGIEEIYRVARRLVDLDIYQCLNIEDTCIELVSQTEIGKDRVKAICKTCTNNEECQRNTTSNRFQCVPSVIPETAEDDTDLILGLGIGLPIFVILLAVTCILCVICIRRRRHQDDSSYTTEVSDPYQIQPAFGSMSSTLTGRRSLYGTDGFLSRQYAKHWERSQDDDNSSVVNYYRDSSDIRDPYRQFYPRTSSRQYIAPNAPPEDPNMTSDFSWDFLYNALDPSNYFRIQRPLVDDIPAEVYRNMRRDSHV